MNLAIRIGFNHLAVEIFIRKPDEGQTKVKLRLNFEANNRN